MLLSCCIGLARSVHERFEFQGSLFTNQYIEVSTVFEPCISVTLRYRSVQITLHPGKTGFIPLFHYSYVMLCRF